ncbi:MAG TPA: murein biosynthesis integral membrane protein MurJ [Gaiellaceae bacterium]|nr:murein biosynthesis integral membrane protein MurJ [Gaiellaceae bacterium]
MSAPADEALSAPVDAGRRRLARSTAIFSLATGLSRILGLVREIVARYYFGTVGAINAFEVAFLIPNTIRALVADAALSSAFVPVFSDLLVKGERKRAWRVASSLFWLALLGLGGLTALFIVLAPWVMRAFGYGSLAVGLSRVLFPIVLLLGLFGIVVGILNSYEHFSVPALTPVFWNVAIIAGLLIGIPHVNGTDHELYVYAFSILVATAIQLLLPIPWLRGRDDRLHVVLDWRDPAVRRTLALMVPITIGLGLINFNAVVDTFFAARLIDKNHAPSAINAAFRLYMLPQGMFSVAVATVLFPSLARLASRDDLDGFRATVARGIRQIAFLLIPASVVCAVLAEPIVRVVYQHGDFTAGQTPATAGALAAFSLGLAFNGFMLMLNRAFFSLQSPWIPTWVALANLGLNAALDAAFYSVGIWGLPLATSLGNIACSAALFVLLRRRLGRIEMGETMRTVVRVTAASAVLAGVAYGLWWLIDRGLGDSLGPALVAVLVALAGGLGAYVVSCRALGVRELEALLALGRRPA